MGVDAVLRCLLNARVLASLHYWTISLVVNVDAVGNVPVDIVVDVFL